MKRGVGGWSAINWETGHPIKQFVRIKGIEEWRAGEGGGRQSREIDLRMEGGRKDLLLSFKMIFFTLFKMIRYPYNNYNSYASNFNTGRILCHNAFTFGCIHRLLSLALFSSYIPSETAWMHLLEVSVLKE